MDRRILLFLGGLGVPAKLFTPWFIAFRRKGYETRIVKNSFLSMAPVTTFAKGFIDLAARYDRFDVIGLSYGGNAALYAAAVSPELSAKIGTMITVCAPLLGAPGLLRPVSTLLPGFLSRPLNEMAHDSEVTARIKELAARRPIGFDLHFVYHERDLIAPAETAILPEAGTPHRLEFAWECVPGLLMHQAACVNPSTLRTVLDILPEGVKD